MTDTPRTDAMMESWDQWGVVPVSFARHLERELNEYKRSYRDMQLIFTYDDLEDGYSFLIYKKRNGYT